MLSLVRQQGQRFSKSRRVVLYFSSLTAFIEAFCTQRTDRGPRAYVQNSRSGIWESKNRKFCYCLPARGTNMSAVFPTVGFGPCRHEGLRQRLSGVKECEVGINKVTPVVHPMSGFLSRYCSHYKVMPMRSSTHNQEL